MTIKKYAGDKITGIQFDSKPTNVPDGATFYETDTKKVYLRTGSAWVEVENTKANDAYNLANTVNAIAIAAFAQANNDTIGIAAFNKANAALANSTGTFAGTLSVTEKIIALPVGGDEGGEIFLGKPPNGNLNGGITIDAYQDKLRIFEQGGSARGVYIDLSVASAGVGTDLLAGGGGGGTDTTARAAASAAYDKANSANLLAFNTGVGANAFSAATIAGANTTVGAGANTYLLATIAGANTAVGAGANAFAAATITGANTAVGAGANAFASATIAGANVISIAAFAKANAALPNTSGVTFAGDLTISSNLTANILNSSAGFIDLGPGSRPAYVEGRIYYDNIDKVLTVYNNDSGFVLPLGQKEYVKVLNDTASTLSKGKAVYATGFHSTSHHHLTVDLADASDSTKYDVVGLVASDIPAGEHGAVITRGWLGGINTSSLTVATRFHLGFANPGDLVTSAPEYPNYPYDIGYCIVANNTNGYVYVDRQSHTYERLRVTSSARVGGDLTVEGNFNVIGSENTITVNSLEVGTQFIYLGVGDSIPNANVYFTGSGLNDIDFNGHYNSTGNTAFYVMISDVSPDKFSWSYLSDFSTLQQQNVAIQYQTSQVLSNGISIYFNANTGHTVGDKWNATAFGTSTDFGFIGNHIDGPNGYSHAGLFRDATDGTFKFFRSYDPEVEGNVDTSNNTFAYANVRVERITANEIYEGTTKLSTNVAIAQTAASAAFDKANSANVLAFNTGIGANAFTSATIAGANTAVGTGANTYLLATIAGANTAVGTGANTYLLATIAGANTAVGAGANSFTSATIAGANTAVGIGANTYLLATIAGANTAVGAGANAFAVATFSAANTRPVGNTLSNAYTVRSTRRSLNFIPGSNITINVDDDSAGDRSNVTITSTATGDGGGGADIGLVADAVNATRYLVFANNTTGNLVTANVTTGLTFNPSSNTLTISGALNAQTKSFVINHPTKEGMFLRYGSLEGPENGVYVRGRLDGQSIIELPEYWWNLVDERSITVNLTPVGRSQDLWVQSTSARLIHLNQPADCFFTVFAERKDVDKLIVEY